MFAGKLIRVRTFYYEGFEQSHLYDPACADLKRFETTYLSWVWFLPKAEECANLKVRKILETFREQGGGELEATFVGEFHGPGKYGHLGGSHFEFVVNCVEHAKLLPEKQDGCSRLDDTQRFHYLAYVGLRQGVETAFAKMPAHDQSHPFALVAAPNDSRGQRVEQIVWLRLVNNSTCPILIPTATAYESKLANGNVTTELQDHDEVALSYELSSRTIRQRSKYMNSPYQRQSVLQPGRSVYFGVPLRYFLKEHYDVRLPFDYVSGKRDEHYEPFYFSSNWLPESLRDRIKYP